MRRKPLARDVILYNITDAREELERIEKELRAKAMGNIEFQIAMRHAFHHLNVAWNARHWTKKRYAAMTEADFKSAGSFPADLDAD